MAATIIAQTAFPLRFTEIINFRNDFYDGPGNPEPGISTPVVCPKGIAYDPDRRTLLVTLSRNEPGYSNLNGVLKEVIPHTGVRTGFASAIKTRRGVESNLIVVPPSGPPVTQAGFSPGDVFVAAGCDTPPPPNLPPFDDAHANQIIRVAANGVVTDYWVNVTTAAHIYGDDMGIWGGLTFDTTGTYFGGNLLAMPLTGKIFKVTSGAVVSQIADISGLGFHPSGIAVAPTTFGTYAGWIIIGIEGSADRDPNSGKVYAINQDGSQLPLLANIGGVADHVVFVPATSGTFYQTQLDFYNERYNRILAASSSQFLGRLGYLLVNNELSGERWGVFYSNGQYYQQLLGRAPGRWSSQGISHEGAELEVGCFAAFPPVTPAWTAFTFTETGADQPFTTDHAVAVTADADGTYIWLVARSNGGNYTAGGIYLKTLTISGSSGTWSNWTPIDSSFTAQYAPAAVSQDGWLLIFAVNSSGNVYYSFGGGSFSAISPAPLGSFTTDRAVCATVVNGYSMICAIKSGDNANIWINSLRSTTNEPWLGWTAISVGAKTVQSAIAPQAGSFQDELYLTWVSGGYSYVKVLGCDGHWTDIVSLPATANPQTSYPVALVSPPQSKYPDYYSKNQFYAVLNAGASGPQINVASETGTWSQWQALPNGGTSDQAYAGAATVTSPSYVHLFGKGTGNQRVYWRHTT
jgi:hypothetical protein